MDQIKKKWHRYHYKNLTYLAVSLIAGFVLLEMPAFRQALFHLGSFGYLGAFIAGILFSSTFTVSISISILMLLAEVLNPIEIGLAAGVGSVVTDLMIFQFVRNRGFISEFKHFFAYFGGDKLNHLIHTKYFSWTLPVVGALIIASPLPDELGVSLMGISKMKPFQLAMLSFALNSTGIFLIVIAGSVLKP